MPSSRTDSEAARANTQEAGVPTIPSWNIILLVGVCLVLAVSDLLITTLSVLLLTLAGLLFAIVLNRFGCWLTDHSPLNYRQAYKIVVLTFGLMVVGGFQYVGTQVATTVSSFWSELNAAWDQLTNQVEQTSWAQAYAPEGAEVQEYLTNGFLTELVQGMQLFGWGAIGVIVIVFVGLYAALEPDLYRAGLIRLFRPERRSRMERLLSEMHATLEHWIVGRLVSMTLIGITTSLGLSWLSVPLPFALGALAGLLTFVPNIGPIVATVPQVLLGLQVGSDTAFYVVVFNIILQTVESYIVTPVVQRYQTKLPPVLTIIAQLLMGTCVGTIGLMMAAPLMAMLIVSLQTLYVQDDQSGPYPNRVAAPPSRLVDGQCKRGT